MPIITEEDGRSSSSSTPQAAAHFKFEFQTFKHSRIYDDGDVLSFDIEFLSGEEEKTEYFANRKSKFLATFYLFLLLFTTEFYN